MPFKWTAIAFVVGVLLGTAAMMFVLNHSPVRSLTLLSPDERYRAELWECKGFDRNFLVKIIDTEHDKCALEFKSPDEGWPPGTERFIWSEDVKHVLLVGRHFYIEQDQRLRLSTGENLYLLIDVDGFKTRCNASQSNLERFSAEQIKNIKFSEDVKLN